MFTVSETLEYEYEETIVSEVSCTENGLMKVECKLCGDSYEEVIETKGHEHYTEVEEATCEADGKESVFCKNYNYLDEKVIPALKHNYIIFEETKNEKRMECDKCGTVDTKIVLASGNIYQSKNATLNNQNLLEDLETLEGFGLEEEYEILKSMGFTFGDVIVPKPPEGVDIDNLPDNQVWSGIFCNTKFLKFQRAFKKVAAGYSSFLQLSGFTSATFGILNTQ